MRFLFTLCFLVLVLHSNAQTYNSQDLNALKDVKTKNDLIDTLNWKDSNSYATWDGITWKQVGSEYRLHQISLSDIPLSGNLKLEDFDYLENVYISEAQLDTISLENLKLLEYFDCELSEVDGLNFSEVPKLIHLSCTTNNIQNIDVSKLKQLESLILSGNKLSSLDLTGLDSLTSLYIGGNKVKTLNLQDAKNLQQLSLAYGEIEQLSLSTLSQLDYLSISHNSIKDLDFTKFPNLNRFWINDNLLPFSSLKTILSLKLLANFSSADYSPQKKIFDSLNLAVGDTVDYNAESDISSTATTFTWYVNDTLATSTDVSRSGGVFTFNNGGNYYCKMTNAEFPNLILQTNTIRVKQSPTVTWPSLSDITYGDSLKTSTMSGAVGAGNFSFETPDTLLFIGNHKVSVKFIPTDTAGYGTIRNQIDVVVHPKYSTKDLAILQKIKQEVDNLDTLNWRGQNYATWSGLTWVVAGSEYKVSELEFDVIPISGTLKVKDLDSLNDIYTNETSLDTIRLENLKALETLECEDSLLTTVVFSNTPEIKNLYCYNSKIDSINLSSLKKLKYLQLFDNKLSSLNLSGLDSLVIVDLSDNNFSNFNLPSLKKLKRLELNQNKIKQFSSHNPSNLEELYLRENDLNTLDLFNFKLLKKLFLYKNDLENIDLTGLDSLESLDFRFNKLRHLDVSALKKMKTLRLESNEIEKIDFSQMSDLTDFACENNRLPFSSLKTVLGIDSLDGFSSADYYPQDKIFDSLNLAIGDTVDYNAEASVKNTATIFTWYVNDTLATSTDVSRSGGVFTFNNVGNYYCKMTNAEFPNLILQTNNIRVKQSPTVTWPSLSDITYGDSLKTSTMSGAVGAGNFSFEKPDTVLNAGNHKIYLKFVPNDIINYEILKQQITVKVKKDEPVISNPPSDSPIVYGQSLLNVVLSGGKATVEGGFKFKFESKKLAVGLHDVILQFIPKNLLFYKIKEIVIDVEVKKAIPVISTLPTVGELLDKSKLSTASLSAGKASVAGIFSFKNPDQILSIGKHLVDVVFTPTDFENYTTVSKQVEVIVKQRVLSVLKNQEITISPNPTNGIFRVEGLKIGSTLKLFDIKGNLLLSKPVSSSVGKLNISKYEQGIYIIKNEETYFRIQLID